MSPSTFRCFLICSAILSSVSCTDDRIHFFGHGEVNAEQPMNNDEVQPRFFGRRPFSTSFSIGAGSDRGHSVGLGVNKDGISLTQSTSLGGGPVAGSQSNSFALGPSGVATSGANAYNVFGNSRADSNSYSLGDAKASSQADVKDGQVSSGAQSAAGNDHNRVSSGASSSAGNGEAQADANADAVQVDDYRGNRPHRPGLGLFRPFRRDTGNGLGLGMTIGNHQAQQQNQWQNENSEIYVPRGRPSREGRPWGNTNCGTFYNGNPDCGNYAPEHEHHGPWPQPIPDHRPEYPIREPWHQHNRRQGTRISAASASSSATSSGNGFAFGKSTSQSNLGPDGRPSSSSNNQVHTHGNAQSNAQGVAAGIQEDQYGQTQGSFSSGVIAGSSQGDGDSHGTAISENHGEKSVGDVTNVAHGTGVASGNANAAAVAFDEPIENGNYNDDTIPNEFLRSAIGDDIGSGRTATPEKKGPIRKILSDINSAVTGLFHH